MERPRGDFSFLRRRVLRVLAGMILWMEAYAFLSHDNFIMGNTDTSVLRPLPDRGRDDGGVKYVEMGIERGRGPIARRA